MGNGEGRPLLRKQKSLQELPSPLRYLLQKAVEAKAKRQQVVLGNYLPNEVIQLGESAVLSRAHPSSTRDDVRAALSRCGLHVKTIMHELDKRALPGMSDYELAAIVVDLLFEAFDNALLDEIAHRL